MRCTHLVLLIKLLTAKPQDASLPLGPSFDLIFRHFFSESVHINRHLFVELEILIPICTACCLVISNGLGKIEVFFVRKYFVITSSCLRLTNLLKKKHFTSQSDSSV